MQILNSPLWTPLGVVATIVLGFVGIYITLWLRNRKALAYEVLFNVSLVTVQESVRGQGGDGIEIRYHGTPVQDVRMVSMRLWNAGNVAIKRDDFDKPIYIAFDGRLLDATVTETIPPHLEHDVLDKASSASDHSGIQLYPLLLNPRDSVTIQAILADSQGTVDLHTRIVGITAIKRYNEGSRLMTSRLARLGVWIVAAGLGSLLSALVANWQHSTFSNVLLPLASVVVVMSMLSSVSVMVYQLTKRRHFI